MYERHEEASCLKAKNHRLEQKRVSGGECQRLDIGEASGQSRGGRGRCNRAHRENIPISGALPAENISLKVSKINKRKALAECK